MQYSIPVSYPVITSYPPYAAQLTLTDEFLKSPFQNDYLNWFILQYSNIVLYTNEHYNGMILFDDIFHTNMLHDSLDSDLLWSEMYSGTQMLRENISFSSFVIDELRRGYALFLYLNFRYFPLLDYPEDYNHEVLITGYDEDTDAFTVYGFYNGQKYNFTIVPRDLLDQSFSTFAQLNNEQNTEDKSTTIRCYKRKNEINIPIDYHALHFLVERWLNGRVLGDLAYGKQCYNFLLEWLSSAPERIDLRSLHLLYDHKRGLKRTCSYIQKCGIDLSPSFFEDIDKLIHESFLLRYIKLKEMMAGTTACNSTLGQRIKRIQETEEKVFLELERKLRNNFS